MSSSNTPNLAGLKYGKKFTELVHRTKYAQTREEKLNGIEEQLVILQENAERAKIAHQRRKLLIDALEQQKDNLKHMSNEAFLEQQKLDAAMSEEGVLLRKQEKVMRRQERSMRKAMKVNVKIRKEDSDEGEMIMMDIGASNTGERELSDGEFDRVTTGGLSEDDSLLEDEDLVKTTNKALAHMRIEDSSSEECESENGGVMVRAAYE